MFKACEWAQLDSNQRPPVCKTGALPTELYARDVRRDRRTDDR